MFKKHFIIHIVLMAAAILFFIGRPAGAEKTNQLEDTMYPVPQLKPTDSKTILTVGDKAPDFTLNAVDGQEITLSTYQGKAKRCSLLCPCRLDAYLY